MLVQHQPHIPLKQHYQELISVRSMHIAEDFHTWLLMKMSAPTIIDVKLSLKIDPHLLSI